ncbi:hypothetical protein B0A55_07580 [Friedmanniomyces simplex]|uniref:Uncharacterized protein n=1 Tax=Friedmanniomyces simplex TaxID=329884 RepID=A0A4U0X5J3_9PEZI|nr:hypothetical protein B0A55_07580 [Friedmanniomyces simplex]
MVGTMAAVVSANIEASCAICGARSYPECPHEGERLQIAFDQALARWTGMQMMRCASKNPSTTPRLCPPSDVLPQLTSAYSDWVLNHARNNIISTFHALRAARHQQHLAYLQSLPCYTLYHRYAGQPPIPPAQLATLHAQMQHANTLFQQGVDDDWRRCCMEYPRVLDYFFGLLDVPRLPDESEEAVREPVFGGGGGGGGAAPVLPREQQRRVKGARRESMDTQSRKKERRRSKGGTPPPPAAPMVVHHHRR